MTAVIYARYSSDLQNDRSVEDQIAHCRAFAAKAGLAVSGTYEDRAISGTRFHDRLGLMRLMRDAKARGFTTLIVEHADRLSRHPADIHSIREALNFEGVKILQVSGGELNALQASVSGLVSTLMLDGHKEKVRRGLAGVLAQGRHPGGRAYGYAAVKGEAGRLAIVAHEAEVVRRIFALYIAGLTPQAIAGRLNAEAVPAPRGPRWNASTLYGSGQRGNGILGNELYAGVITWNKVRMVQHPETRRRLSRPNPPEEWRRIQAPELAIVDAETFAAAQSAMSRRKNMTFTRTPKRLLSGLLRCPDCGGGMSVKDRKGSHIRIICSTRHESGSCGNARAYNLKRVEQGVVSGLARQLATPEAMQIYVDAYNAERQRLERERAGGRESVERLLATATANLDRAVALLINGTASPETMKPKILALEAEKARLQGEMAVAPASGPVILKSAAIASYRAQLLRLAADLEGPEQGPKQKLREMVSKVTVHHDYRLDITGNLAPILAGGAVVAGDRSVSIPPLESLPFCFSVAA